MNGFTVITFVVNITVIGGTIGGTTAGMIGDTTTIAAKVRRTWPREKRGQGLVDRRCGNVIRS